MAIPEWVTGAVAGRLLQTTHANVIALARRGAVRRKLRRLTHVQVKPAWFYNLSDILKIKAQRNIKPLTLETLTDSMSADCEHIPVEVACYLLRCSSTSMALYRKEGFVSYKARCFFKYPKNRFAPGVLLADIVVMLQQQLESHVLSAVEEELMSQISVKSPKELVEVLTSPNSLITESITERERFCALAALAIDNLVHAAGSKGQTDL